jgi:competence protein ComEA
MFENQIRGLIVIFLILAIIPLIIFFSNFFSNYKVPVLVNQYNNTLTLEIKDKDTGDGIYFTAPETTASQLLNLTGIDFRIEKDFMLEDGMKLIIDSNSVKKVSLTAIDNSRRLALGMPIDLNSATFDDLLLIPGIGEITAGKILTFRSKKVYFKNMEELMEISGIKEKKLAKLKQYLYVKK